MKFDEEERYIVEQIQRIQKEYQMVVEPWINRLAALRALRPSREFLQIIEVKP